MSGQEHEKIKSLLEAVPAGFLVDSAWLARHGIGHRSAYYYVKRGWLERITRGVFRRPTPGNSTTTRLDWQICLLSLQHIMDYKLHVGGMMALALQGYSHYLPLGGNATVSVYGADIPNWLTRLPLTARLETRNVSLFDDPALDLSSQETNSASPALPWDWALTRSSPERAILEALDELPDHESFHNLDMVFEGLTTLRPRRLSALLGSCRKIKVTRLFLVFADRHDHAWRKHLMVGNLNLGRGDRTFVKGGKIHPRYRIMVPAEFTRDRSNTETA